MGTVRTAAILFGCLFGASIVASALEISATNAECHGGAPLRSAPPPCCYDPPPVTGYLYDPPPCCVYVYMHFTYDEFVETLLSGRIALLAKIGRRKAALFRFLSVECEPAVRRHCKMSKLHVGT